MNIVIQCAASKHSGGSLRNRDGQRVCFVANPELASRTQACIYARPDDPSGEGGSWRERLEEYVSRESSNPLALLKAYQLYKPKPYALLVEHFTEEKVFILSAGWGLIRADYLTPEYDITFNLQARKKNPSAYCKSRTGYKYFQQILEGGKDPIVFLGGKSYLPLFRSLVEPLNRRTIVFVRAGMSSISAGIPVPEKWEVRQFRTPVLTNWHYECAEALACGVLSLD